MSHRETPIGRVIRDVRRAIRDEPPAEPPAGDLRAEWAALRSDSDFAYWTQAHASGAKALRLLERFAAALRDPALLATEDREPLSTLGALEREVRWQLANAAPGLDPMASLNRRDLDAKFAALRSALKAETPDAAEAVLRILNDSGSYEGMEAVRDAIMEITR